MRRYARLLLLQLRTAALLAAQYRVDFVLDGLIEVVWTSTALAPLLVAFGRRDALAGWMPPAR